MQLSTRLKGSFLLAFLLVNQPVLSAVNVNPWYVSASVGTFQGMFNVQYNDQTDVIPGNFRESVLQNGYVGALAGGYSQVFRDRYLLGAELSANFPTGNAYFASGSPSSAFTDTLNVRSFFDLVFVPGVLLTDTIAVYGKAGVSNARVHYSLNSPTGFDPTFISRKRSKTVLGAALGLGIKKMLTNHLAIFTEYNYHDYGTVDFANFQNFTATYTHSTHLAAQSVLVGASYSC